MECLRVSGSSVSFIEHILILMVDLIHDERNTMRPFEASKESAELERTLEDMIKIGLVDFINDHVVQGKIPTDEDLLEEGRKIIREAEAISKTPSDVEMSWFRDLIMLSGKNPKYDSAKLEEMAPAGYSEFSGAERLEMINWRLPKDIANLDRIRCSKERALLTFVHARQSVGLTPTDSELQVQACKVLDDVEVSSNFKCKGAVSWFKYLIVSEPSWLAEFRRRAGLPRSSELSEEHIRSTDETTIDYSIHNFSRFENELREYARTQLAAGITPTDTDLQRKARLIIYKNDDPWNQTAADDPALLHLFKRQNGLAPSADDGPDLPAVPEVSEFGTGNLPSTTSSPRSLHWDLQNIGIGMVPSPFSGSDRQVGPITGTSTSTPSDAPLHTLIQNQPSTNTNPTQPLRYFLNDVNCYGRLVRGLTRFVTSCMSPNNPNQHVSIPPLFCSGQSLTTIKVPSDAEIQNQARWVIYDDDDPWNQTAADNAEWLIRFKRDVGLVPQESGPGLPVNQPSWSVGMGGTGFSPPYLNPKAPPAAFTEDVAVKMHDKVYKVPAKTAGKFLQSMSERWQKPATVFCSRDLEDGLGAFVKDQMSKGVNPTDDVLRSKAREILGVGETAADDVQLLEKFKSLHGITGNPTDLLDLSPASNLEATGPMPDFTLPNFTDDVEMLAEFDMDLGAMDLTTPFGAGATDFGLGPDGGASLMGMDVIGIEVSTQSSTPENHSPGTQGGTSGVQKNLRTEAINEGAMQDYAELYRVHAATASPLRRRASEKAAQRLGRTYFGNPREDLGQF
jgi:hypothetical protein